MEGADDTCGVTAAGIVVNYASLFVTCIASYRIALFVAPLSIGPISIPRGTGFMLVGMLAAGLRPRMIKCAGATYPVFGGGTADTVDDVELNVYFPINYVCMCFIAYATGSELIVRRYRKLYKKILKVTLMVILSVFLCVSFPLFLLLDAPTSRDAVFDAGDAKLPAMSAPSLRWAVALLFGSILVSRSPASAISIVGEMRANGDYTQSALGVTICMYVGVNVVFAICQAVSIILLSGQETLTDSLANATALGDAAASANVTGAGDGEGTDAVGVVLIFAAVLLSLFVSIVLGILLGLVLYAFVSLPLRVWGKMALRIRSPLFAIYSKAALCLSLGLLVFVLRDALKWVSAGERFGKFSLKVEPMLTCLIAGAFVVNFRDGAQVEEWNRMCKSIAPYVYCTFFTLAGGALMSSNISTESIFASVILVLLRFVGVLIGSTIGGLWTREPGRNAWHYRILWMNYVTQARCRRRRPLAPALPSRPPRLPPRHTGRRRARFPQRILSDARD